MLRTHKGHVGGSNVILAVPGQSPRPARIVKIYQNESAAGTPKKDSAGAWLRLCGADTILTVQYFARPARPVANPFAEFPALGIGLWEAGSFEAPFLTTLAPVLAHNVVFQGPDLGQLGEVSPVPRHPTITVSLDHVGPNFA